MPSSIREYPRTVADQEHKQVGPPARVGDYMISVVNDVPNHGTLARAVNVNEHDILPKQITIMATGLIVEPSSSGTVAIPNDVLEALLKVGGWKHVQRE